MTQEELKKLLHYDPKTGVFTRLVSRGNQKAGSVAGSLSNGYVQISVNNKLYKAHRLAWLYVYGEWPKKSLDHINQKRDDNRIENLREASGRQNQLNIKGKNGYLGVTARNEAKARTNSKQIHIGTYATPEIAARCRDAWLWLNVSEEDKEFVVWNFPGEQKKSVEIYLQAQRVQQRNTGYTKLSSGNYKSQIHYQNRMYSLGTYKTKDEARVAFDIAATHLKKSKINFPQHSEIYQQIIEETPETELSEYLKLLAKTAVERIL